MKVSHRDLASLERDPKAWARARQLSGKAWFSIGYDKVLKLGIRFFERGNSTTAARAHIQRILGNNEMKNIQRIEDLFERFERYVGWRQSADLNVMETAVRLNQDLGVVTLIGEVDRVELLDEGYRGVLLGRSEDNWRDELRMPLLQRALAERYEKPIQSFAIGVQELDASGLQEVRFDAKRIAAAEARLAQLIEASGIG